MTRHVRARLANRRVCGFLVQPTELCNIARLETITSSIVDLIGSVFTRNVNANELLIFGYPSNSWLTCYRFGLPPIQRTRYQSFVNMSFRAYRDDELFSCRERTLIA